MTDVEWHVEGRLIRTAHGVVIGVMDTEAMAAAVVAEHNWRLDYEAYNERGVA